MDQKEIDISLFAGKEVVQEYFKKRNLFIGDDCITATRTTLTYTIPQKFIGTFLETFGYCTVKHLRAYIKYNAILCQCHISLPLEQGRAICFLSQSDILDDKLEEFIDGNPELESEVYEDGYNLRCCYSSALKKDLRITNDINLRARLLEKMDKIITS